MLTPEEAMAEYKRPAKRHQVTVTVTEGVHQRIIKVAEAEGISGPEVVKSALRVFFSMLDGSASPEKAQSAPADEPKETKPRASSRSRRKPPKPELEPETEADDAEDSDEDTRAAPEGADSEFDDWD